MTNIIREDETDRAISTDVAVADFNATVVLPGNQGFDAACHSNQQPPNDCEAAIRVLAHRKWEAAGYPAGDGLEFWLEAEQEVNAERSGSSAAHKSEIDS